MRWDVKWPRLLEQGFSASRFPVSRLRVFALRGDLCTCGAPAVAFCTPRTRTYLSGQVFGSHHRCPALSLRPSPQPAAPPILPLAPPPPPRGASEQFAEPSGRRLAGLAATRRFPAVGRKLKKTIPREPNMG